LSNALRRVGQPRSSPSEVSSYARQRMAPGSTACGSTIRGTRSSRSSRDGCGRHVLESISGHLSRRMLEHYSHIRIDAKCQALDALDAARRNAAPNRNGDGYGSKGKEEAPDEGDIDALVEVSGERTSQSRYSLRLSGSPPRR
jgi:hypothetical protein